MNENAKQKREIAVHISNNISSLLEIIQKKVKSNEFHPKECVELKILKEKCCDDNLIISHTAFKGIVILVEQKFLNPNQAISSIICLLPSLSNYSALILSIGNILFLELEEQLESTGNYECPYNYSDRLHPFIVILRHDTERSWNALYSYIECLLCKYENIKYTYKIELLRSVFIYVLQDQTDFSLPFKNQLFTLLLNQIQHPKVKILIFHALAWQKLDINYCWLIQKTQICILNSTLKDMKELIGAIAPYLAVAVKWLIHNGHSSILMIDLLFESLKINNAIASLVLCILSDIMLETPVPFINNLVEICKYIICSTSCNKYMAYKFVSNALVWMVNPSFLTKPAIANLEYILKFLNNKDEEWNDQMDCYWQNSYFDILKNSNSEVNLSFKVLSLSNSWKRERERKLNWIKHFSTSKNLLMKKKLQSFIAGILLCEKDDETLEICLEILQEISYLFSDFSFFHLCVIFYKLSREEKPRNQLKYLKALPKLANSKDNVPIIVGIIESLKKNGSEIMLPVVMDLYLKLWKLDNRTYPYLHKVLFSTSIRVNSWEIYVMKTTVIKDVCRISPELYGKNLVSKLSEILNDCNSFFSGIPSAIAIEAVVELCKAQVINVFGTWKALKPKLSNDKRKEVIISLCKLFTEIPNSKFSETEYNDLISDVIPRLWQYAFSMNQRVAKEALKSLARFNPENYGFQLLPDELKAEVTILNQYSKSSSTFSEKQFLLESNTIPGECWVTFLRKIDPSVSGEAAEMLMSLVELELNSLPRSIFHRAEEIPEPINYSYLPCNSICRALINHIRKYLISSNDEEKDIPLSIVDSLRILSADYTRCLPPLNWSFLKNFFALDNLCKKFSIMTLAKQAVGSKASKEVLENYIKDNLQFGKVDNLIILYSALPSICNALGPNTLRQFLDVTIKRSCELALTSKSDCFEKILSTMKTTLESKAVLEPRKALLRSLIQNVSIIIPAEHKIMKKYAKLMAEFPPKIVDCNSSPTSWTEITSSKLRQAVIIRSAVALRPDSSKPLEWFNEYIDSIISLPNDYSFLLNNILMIAKETRNLYHGDWIIELMWRIQASASAAFTTETVKVTLFLLDLFINCIVILSGFDCFTCEHSDDADKVFDIFPISLFELLEQPEWTLLTSKILEWIINLSKWKNIPRIYSETFEQAILSLRSREYFFDKKNRQTILKFSTFK